MSSGPPTLGEIPKNSEFNVPTLGSQPATVNTGGDQTTVNGVPLRDTMVNNASAAVNTVQNHPVTQQTKDAVINGPVGVAVRDETTKTSNDISNLANARAAPSEPAATGQPLTNYHSFFYSLLSWEHKRATAIAFASTLAFIFAARYLNVFRLALKAVYVVLGITAAAELAGKLVLGTGFATSIRPRRYYTIPKETLEATLDDVEQLINFFVIEAQRIFFAERPAATVAAFLAAFTSYYLIKIVPFWGLSLIATCIGYLGPLIYIENRELIDGHIENASNIVSAQTSQVMDLAGQHTQRATSTVKQYAGDYATKAQEMTGTGKSRQKIVKENDFPQAPRGEFEGQSAAAPQPIPAS